MYFLLWYSWFTVLSQFLLCVYIYIYTHTFFMCICIYMHSFYVHILLFLYLCIHVHIHTHMLFLVLSSVMVCPCAVWQDQRCLWFVTPTGLWETWEQGRIFILHARTQPAVTDPGTGEFWERGRKGEGSGVGEGRKLAATQLLPPAFSSREAVLWLQIWGLAWLLSFASAECLTCLYIWYSFPLVCYARSPGSSGSFHLGKKLHVFNALKQNLWSFLLLFIRSKTVHFFYRFYIGILLSAFVLLESVCNPGVPGVRMQ